MIVDEGIGGDTDVGLESGVDFDLGALGKTGQHDPADPHQAEHHQNKYVSGLLLETRQAHFSSAQLPGS